MITSITCCIGMKMKRYIVFISIWTNKLVRTSYAGYRRHLPFNFYKLVEEDKMHQQNSSTTFKIVYNCIKLLISAVSVLLLVEPLYNKISETLKSWDFLKKKFIKLDSLEKKPPIGHWRDTSYKYKLYLRQLHLSLDFNLKMAEHCAHFLCVRMCVSDCLSFLCFSLLVSADVIRWESSQHKQLHGVWSEPKGI